MMKNQIIKKEGIEKVIESNNTLFQNRIELFKKRAIIAEKYFFRIDFDKLKNEGLSGEDTKLYLCLRYLIFCLPDKVKLKLEELGFKKHNLKWFIPYEAIYTQIQKINTNGQVYIEPEMAFRLIEPFINFKIMNETLMVLNKTTDKIKSKSLYNIAHEGFHHYFRKRDRTLNAGIGMSATFKEQQFLDILVKVSPPNTIKEEYKIKNFDKDPQIQALHNIVNELKETFFLSEAELKNHFSSISQGKSTKIYLPHLIDSIKIVEGHTLNEKELYLSFIDLFILLLKDQYFQSEKEHYTIYRNKNKYDAYLVKKIKDSMKSYKK